VPITRDDGAALDAANPIAFTRDRFDVRDGLLNLDGNSLGTPPRAVAARLASVTTGEWGERLIRSWDERWWELPVVVGDRIGRLIGAAPGQTVAGDSTSVCIYRALVCALRLNPGKSWIVYDADDFPTDRYLIEEVGRAYGKRVEGVHRSGLVGALCDDTAVVIASHVDYRTADVLDLADITAAAHAHGALIVWDLSHSVGALPVDLDGAGVDLAVGCSYKYLNGGPGAPAWTYVAARHLPGIDTPLPGWVGHADPFSMEPAYRGATGIRRLLTGTPAVLSLSALDAALDAFDGVTMAQLRTQGLSLTDLFIALVDERLAWPVESPRPHERRGSHVSLRQPGARAVVAALAERGVIADARATGGGPADLVRLGFAPLYIRHVDVWDAVDQLVAVAATGG
jgi:kynureninase